MTPTSPNRPIPPKRRFGPLRDWRGGVVLIVVGIVLSVTGLLQTTSGTGNPTVACPSGTTLVAKFNFGGGGCLLKGLRDDAVGGMDEAAQHRLVSHDADVMLKRGAARNAVRGNNTIR